MILKDQINTMEKEKNASYLLKSFLLPWRTRKTTRTRFDLKVFFSSRILKN